MRFGQLNRALCLAGVSAWLVLTSACTTTQPQGFVPEVGRIYEVDGYRYRLVPVAPAAY